MMGRTAQRRWCILDSTRCRLYYCRAANSTGVDCSSLDTRRNDPQLHVLSPLVDCRGYVDLAGASISFEDAAYSACLLPLWLGLGPPV